MAANIDIFQIRMLKGMQDARRKPDFASSTEASGFEKILLESMYNRPSEFNSVKSPVNIEYTAGLQPNDDVKFRKCLDFVLQKEGNKLVKEDGERGASRYGILQPTARSFGYQGNIKNITQGQVEEMYRKIWDKSGAGSLPYPLCIVHFDTYVNSPSAAQRLLKKSGKDIDSYLNMREKRYVRLAAGKPQVYAKYLKGWRNRINSLRDVVAQYEGDAIYAKTEGLTGKKG